MTPPVETPCAAHEEQIQELSRKTTELETRSKYKEDSIKELKADMKELKESVDTLNETVNKVMLNSIKDDNDLKQRVLALETQIKTQNDTIAKYKQEAKDQRDEDRQKMNLRLTAISVGLAILIFALTYIFK